MNAVLALALVAAGLALIVGARETAKRIGFAVLAVIVGMSIASCLLCWLSGVTLDTSLRPTIAVFVAAALVVIGLVAWRRRADRGKARELWARRNGAPRARALPTAPSNRNEDHR